MIPKIVHLYWAGPKLSFLRYLTVFTLSKYNPDYEIRVYLDSNKSEKLKVWNSFEYSELYDGEHNYLSKLKYLKNVKVLPVPDLGCFKNYSEIHRSDIIRIKLLYDVGGIWSDFDIIYIKPLSYLIKNQPPYSNIKDFDTYICNLNAVYYIGFMAASKNNNYFAYLICKIKSDNIKPDSYQCFGNNLYKKYMNDIPQTERELKLNICKLNKNAFYKVNFDELNMFYTTIPIDDSDIIGFHWCGGHPNSEILENYITEQNYNLFDMNLIKIINKACKI